MRRNDEKRKASVYNYGKGITNQTLLYQHMSNHYRRILNAKKAVDNSPPASYKERRTQVSSSSSLPIRSFSKKFISGSISPALTERSASTYSNGCSLWATDSFSGRRCHNTRTIECNCSARLGKNPNSSDMELINEIAFETKHGPGDCFEVGWKDEKDKCKFNEFRSPYEAKKNSARTLSANSKKVPLNKSKATPLKRKLPLKDKNPSDVLESHSKCFTSCTDGFCPRILKTDASSKIRTMKVYHPPRKRITQKKTTRRKENERNDFGVESESMMKSKCSDHVFCQKRRNNTMCRCKQMKMRETGQTSSRDSAYNGGVSSLPDSRSPTPDQKKQPLCSCHLKATDAFYENVRNGNENLMVPNLVLPENRNSEVSLENGKTMKSDFANRSEMKTQTPVSTKRLIYDEKHAEKSEKVTTEQEREYFIRKIKEEAMYTNFIRDITAEVLEKGLFTNKALKKVMKKHVVSNLWHLDKDRMLSEVNKLRIQLGVPEDKELMNISMDSPGSPQDTDDCYPTISDSELIQIDRTKEMKSKSNLLGKCSRDCPKSISEVLASLDSGFMMESDSADEDEELISVIQVSKMINEKKHEDSISGKDTLSDRNGNLARADSADESEQSSDYAIRRKKSTLKSTRKPEKKASSDEVGSKEEKKSSRKNSLKKKTASFAKWDTTREDSTDDGRETNNGEIQK